VKSKHLIFTEDPFRKETALPIAIISEKGDNIVMEHNVSRITNPPAKFLVKQILRYINNVTYDHMPEHFGPHFTLK
jgi:hypothetical protein